MLQLCTVCYLFSTTFIYSVLYSYLWKNTRGSEDSFLWAGEVVELVTSKVGNEAAGMREGTSFQCVFFHFCTIVRITNLKTHH